MENIKAQIAFDLIPILRHLYDGGVIGVYLEHNGNRGAVQMTVPVYHETFPEDTVPMPNPDSTWAYRWTTTIEGVEFFALAENV